MKILAKILDFICMVFCFSLISIIGATGYDGWSSIYNNHFLYIVVFAIPIGLLLYMSYIFSGRLVEYG